VLAYLLNPVVTLLERRIGIRWVAVLVTVVGVLALIGTLLVVLLPKIGEELSKFDAMISQLRDSGSALARRLRRSVENPSNKHFEWLVDQVREFLVSEDFRSLMAKAAQAAVPTAWGVVAGALKLVLGLISVALVLLYLIFLLIDYRLASRAWREYLPPAYRERILEFADEFQ